MNCESKINEFSEKIENDKILMETEFANMENIIKETENMDYEKLVILLSKFNDLNPRYEQLCNDLILFTNTFKSEDEQEIRIYKTEELIELLENEITKLDNQK